MFLFLFKKFPLILFSHPKSWGVMGTPAMSAEKGEEGVIFTTLYFYKNLDLFLFKKNHKKKKVRVGQMWSYEIRDSTCGNLLYFYFKFLFFI